MKRCANAALTLTQRQEVKRLHQEEGISIRQLAKPYHINPSTILPWVKRDTPDERTNTPRPCWIVTPDYRQAHPTHRPIRITPARQNEFPQAHRGSISRILQQEKLSQAPKPKRKPWQIPLGRHRVQMDVQQQEGD